MAAKAEGFILLRVSVGTDVDRVVPASAPVKSESGLNLFAALGKKTHYHALVSWTAIGGLMTGERICRALKQKMTAL
jgi:hypothetical protein